MSVQPIPAGCNTLNVYLIAKDAQAAIDFYIKAFHGKGGVCLNAPDGSIVHGEVMIGNSTLMISQENPQWEMKSAETLGGSPASLHLYVEDCAAVFENAIAAGCTEISPIMDMFWGDRYGKVMDPFGFQWGIATHIEDVDDEEMAKRAQEWFAQMASASGQ